MKGRISIFFVIVFAAGCGSNAENSAPVTTLDALNDFVRTAPVRQVNVDDSPVHEINLDKENFIFNVSDNPDKDSPLLGRMFSVTYFNNHFFVFDSIQSAVFKLTKEGEVTGPLTRIGQGPGEHSFARDLKSNRQGIYLSDWNNARVNRYDGEMNYIEALINKGNSVIYHQIDLNDTFILYLNPKSRGFTPENPEQGLIAISSIDDLADTVKTILPRIIPPGFQPQVFNMGCFSINRYNRIMAGYCPLPWIFLYDDSFKLESVLIINHSIMEEMDLPAMDLFKPIGNEGYGGSIPFKLFKLMDNGDIFLAIKNELIHIEPGKSLNDMSVTRYRFTVGFMDANPGILDIYKSDSENIYYAGNWEHLFQFMLPVNHHKTQ